MSAVAAQTGPPLLFAGAVAHAGFDPTLDDRALRDDVLSVIITRRGSCSWAGDGPPGAPGWVVTLHSPEELQFYRRTLEEALAWCLAWLMAPELGIGPLRV